MYEFFDFFLLLMVSIILGVIITGLFFKMNLFLLPFVIIIVLVLAWPPFGF